jgi:hypothetical protein
MHVAAAALIAFAGDPFAELAQRLADSAPDFRQTPGVENEYGDRNEDENLSEAEHGGTIARGGGAGNRAPAATRVTFGPLRGVGQR